MIAGVAWCWSEKNRQWWERVSLSVVVVEKEVGDVYLRIRQRMKSEVAVVAEDLSQGNIAWTRTSQPGSGLTASQLPTRTSFAKHDDVYRLMN